MSEEISIPLGKLLREKWRLKFYRADRRRKVGMVYLEPISPDRYSYHGPAGNTYKFEAEAKWALPLVGKTFTIDVAQVITLTEED